MKSYTLWGASYGLALTLFTLFGGVTGFFLGIFLPFLCGIIGAHFDGYINLFRITDGLRNRD